MAQQENKTTVSLSVVDQQAAEIAIDAYIYGYPLVLMDVTRQISTNVSRPGENGAPLNRLGNKRSFPDPSFTTVVSPNADTLYSFAFLDLAREPMVLSVPDMDGRYYLMQMLDGWTNVFASPGTRTTGNGKGSLAIVGPTWQGSVPDGVVEIHSPTALVWIIGRTQTNGKGDYAAVHSVQDKYGLVPLSSFGKLHQLPGDVLVNRDLDMSTPPADQVARMNAVTFFNRLNGLMKNNPPSPADAAALQRFARIGVATGRPFRADKLDPVLANRLDGAVRDAQEKIAAQARLAHGKNVNGWEFMMNVGRYGTDYLWRAVVAQIGLGANLPEDAIYPRATRDADGRPLTGASRYEIRFPKGQLPPVGAFWSVTMYNDRQFFVPNPIDRYAIGDRDKLQFNRDGSLSLYVQNESPGKDRESNWLPAPEGSFNLCMRLYWPGREIINGVWKPPRIERKAAEHRKIA
jgi:hypothetical protein